MKPYIASLINALTLVSLGLLGYFISATPSFTAFMPVIIGAVLLVLNPLLKKENKIAAHVIVLLTLIILFGLVMPLKGAIQRADIPAVIRVAVMMITTVWALITFVKSFKEARRKTV